MPSVREFPTDRSLAMSLAMSLVALGLSAGATVLAAPPPNADVSLAPWFHSLQTKDGKSCCDQADCRRYPVKISDGHYWIQYQGEWAMVPDESVDRDRMDNPTGDYIACIVPNRFPILVLCFFLRPDS